MQSLREIRIQKIEKMEKAYSEILGKGLESYAIELAKQQEVSPEKIRIVIKIQNGVLGAFLFNDSKFVRRIDLVELVKVLM